MSSENSYPRCAVDIRPSRFLLLHACLLLAAALLAPWLAGLSALLAVAVDAMAVSFSLPLFRWAHGALSRIVWFSDGRWLLLDGKGREHSASGLSEGILVGARLVALHWRCSCCERPFRIALCRDNSDASARRQLVVRLRATPDEELFGR